MLQSKCHLLIACTKVPESGVAEEDGETDTSEQKPEAPPKEVVETAELRVKWCFNNTLI